MFSGNKEKALSFSKRRVSLLLLLHKIVFPFFLRDPSLSYLYYIQDDVENAQNGKEGNISENVDINNTGHIRGGWPADTNTHCCIYGYCFVNTPQQHRILILGICYTGLEIHIYVLKT